MTIGTARVFAIAATLFLAHAAPPVMAQGVEPGQMIKVKAAPVSLSPGGTAVAVVTIELLPHYEIVASPPPNEWVTSATLAVTSARGVIAKTPVFPPSETIQDPDSEIPVPVWRSSIEVRVPLEASPKAPLGQRSLKATLRYQARFEGDYYRPATREVAIPVTIVKAQKGSDAKGAAAPPTRP